MSAGTPRHTTPLDRCDLWDDCLTCPRPTCPYDTPARERMFRGREDAARHLLTAGYSPDAAADVTGLAPAYVRELAARGGQSR